MCIYTFLGRVHQGSRIFITNLQLIWCPNLTSRSWLHVYVAKATVLCAKTSSRYQEKSSSSSSPSTLQTSFRNLLKGKPRLKISRCRENLHLTQIKLGAFLPGISRTKYTLNNSSAYCEYIYIYVNIIKNCLSLSDPFLLTLPFANFLPAGDPNIYIYIY
jgi:hypothetical protein